MASAMFFNPDQLPYRNREQAGMPLRDFLASPLPALEPTGHQSQAVEDHYTDIVPARMHVWETFADEVLKFEAEVVSAASDVGGPWYGSSMDEYLYRAPELDDKMKMSLFLESAVNLNTPQLRTPLRKHKVRLGRPELGFLKAKGRGVNIGRDEYLVAGVTISELDLPSMSSRRFLDVAAQRTKRNRAQGIREMQRVVARVFSYMKTNLLKFGLISTWERTWFLVYDGSSLGMSEPVSRTSKPLLSFWYLLYLALQGGTCTPSASQMSSYTLPFFQCPMSADWKAESIREQLRSASGNWGMAIRDEVLDNLEAWDASVLMELLGNGQKFDFQCTEDVFRVKYKGRDAVVKVRDLSGTEGKTKLQGFGREVQAYTVLKSLQGRIIPELLAHGVANGTMFAFVVLEYAGQRKFLSGAPVQLALHSIHQLGVGHGAMNYGTDVLVREENELERPVLVGFSRSFFFQQDRPTESDMELIFEDLEAVR